MKKAAILVAFVLLSVAGHAQQRQQKNAGLVTAPVVIKSADPIIDPRWLRGKEHSITVVLTITEEGLPTNVHVTKSVSEELDRSAVESVSKYRFKPAMEDGHPVAVELTVEVDFKFRAD